MPTETTINVVPKLGGNAYKKAADTDFDTSIFEDTNEPDETPVKKSKSEQFTEEWDEEVRKDLGDFEDDASEDEEPVEEEDTDEDSGEEVEDTVEEPKKEPVKESRSEKRIKNLLTKIKSIAAQKDAEFAEETAKLYQRIAFLESKVNNQTGDLANVMVESAEKRLNAAKSKLRAAKENMDTEAELDAIDELTDAKSALREAQVMSKKAPSKDQNLSNDVSPVSIMSTKKTNTWVKANPEFAQNPQLAQFVSTVAQAVESEGYEPYMDEYYEVINKRVNDRLAKMGVKFRAKGIYDSYTDLDDTLDFEDDAPIEKAPVKKAINPASGGLPPSSSKKSGTKARLSAEDVELARRMGVDPRVLLKQQVVSKGAEKGTTTTGSRVVKGWNEVFIPTKSKK